MKRHLWISLILALILSGGSAIATAATSGLVAYYPFSGNADDASGNGYNLTVSGATLTTDRNGTANSAYLFNGTSSGMSASAGSAFSLTSLTLAAWIKVSGAGDNNPRIVALGPAGSAFQNYSLILEGNGSSRRLWFYTSEAVSNAYSTFKIDSDSTWHFVTVTFDAGKVTFYLDGSYGNETSVTGSLNSLTSGVLQVGYSANGLDRFNGALDEIRIFNRALTDAEIKSMYVQDTAFGITSETEPSVLLPGTGFNWSYQITPGTNSSEAVDLVAALAFPDQSLLFFSDQGITNQLLPFKRNFEVDKSGSGGFVFSGFPFPSGLSEGYYTFYTLLVRSGNLIGDSNNWVSNLGSSQVYYAALSPAQQGLIGESGYPNRFIKSFSEEDLGKRVDETWAYAAEGKIRSFVNGDYSGQEDTFVDTTAPQNAVHPQDFTFETTPEAIISKYGQPAPVETKTVWSGTFNHYIYNSLAFSFLNNTLVSVISVGSAASTTNYETYQTPMSKCPDSKTAGRRSINEFTASMLKMEKSGFEEARILSDALKGRKGAAATATASETVNTGVLFTYASLLGLAAQQGVQGAQSAWDSCMAGITSTAPTETNLDCFKNALSTLSIQSGEPVMEPDGFSDWVNWLSSLWSDAQSNESTTGEEFVPAPTQNPGQTGYASLSVTPVRAKTGDTVQFTFLVSEKVLGQGLKSATITGQGLSERMWKSGDGVYIYNWTVSAARDTKFYFDATAVYGDGQSSVAGCGLYHVTTPKVSIYGGIGETVWGPSAFVFPASISGSVPPYYFQWNLGGDARTSGPKSDRIDEQAKLFSEPGAYTISVTVTDARDQSASASGSVKVNPKRLSAAFSAQPSELKKGEAGQFCVSASGGSPPYIYTFASSEGFAQAGTNACASLTFSTSGVKTVSVEVEDTASDFQSTTISCQVLVSGTQCDPATQETCGTGCMPIGAYCCGSGYCTSGPCCGTGCCSSSTQSCCGGAACCNDPNDCCFDKTGIAGCCSGGNCCPSGGCCSADEQCCGGGCCKPGSYCSGGTCVPY